MTDELDAALRARLARLAEAVPVDRPRRVRSAPVAVRSRGGSVVGAFAAAVALLVVVLAATTLGGAPSDSPPPSAPLASPDGAVVGTASDDSFRLTLRAPKSRYAPSEPINAFAELEYLGPNRAITVFSHPGVPGFGVTEVDGDRRVFPGYDMSCEKYGFDRGRPVRFEWTKSGSSTDGDPNAAFVDAYLNVTANRADPVLRLPAGTWQLFAQADFADGECGPPSHDLRAEITITVADGPVVGTASDDSFRVTIRAPKSRYTPDEPIEAAAELEYLGPEASVELFSTLGVPTFEVEEVGGDRAIVNSSLLVCESVRRLDRGVPVIVPWEKAGAPWNKAAGSEDEAFGQAYFNMVDLEPDPLLRLPVGTWRIRAVAAFGEGGCDTGRHNLAAEITIRVTPAEADTRRPYPPPPIASVEPSPAASELPYLLVCATYDRSVCERYAEEVVARAAERGKTVVAISITGPCRSTTTVFDDGTATSAESACFVPTPGPGATPRPTPAPASFPFDLECGPVERADCEKRATELAMWHAGHHLGRRVVSIELISTCDSVTTFDDRFVWETDHCARPPSSE